MEKFDVIGDVHGELPALMSLGRELGYREDWTHPEGRKLIFLGDLVDRGAYSLETAELVHSLALAERAVCIMGNHEYNLVAHDLRVPGYEHPKTSNRPTIEDQQQHPERWRAVLEFFRTLPMALEFPELRLVHACWHKPSMGLLEQVLRPGSDVDGLFADRVVLTSPFARHGLRQGLSSDCEPTGGDPAQEIILKGYEEPSEPFHDVDGHERRSIRTTWWNAAEGPVARDRALVVGHYWNLPPDERILRAPSHAPFCPPFPSGHPNLKRWQAEYSAIVSPTGRARWTDDVACIDFNGVTHASATRASVGALRWPEREIVWASGPKTRAAHGGIADQAG